MKASAWKPVDIVAYVLIIVGALNWGLVGFFSFDLVATLFGGMTTLSRIVYALVGLAAVYELIAVPGQLRRWGHPTRAEATREQEHVRV